MRRPHNRGLGFRFDGRFGLDARFRRGRGLGRLRLDRFGRFGNGFLGRGLLRLGLRRRFRLGRRLLLEAPTVGKATDAIGRRLVNARRVALHPDLELVREIDDDAVLDAELTGEFVDPDLLRGQNAVLSVLRCFPVKNRAFYCRAAAEPVRARRFPRWFRRCGAPLLRRPPPCRSCRRHRSRRRRLPARRPRGSRSRSPRRSRLRRR